MTHYHAASLTHPARYTQCELMSVHYKTPVLLIEFEEDKAFSLEVRRAPAQSSILSDLFL